MRWLRAMVMAVVVVLVVSPQTQRVDAGVRAPLAETGRRPLTARIAAGGDSEHGIATCVVNSDGTVRCWGDRGAITRQLGSNSTPFIPQSAPVAIEGVSDAVAVAVGQGHACALRGDGRMICWGENTFGQLGLGVTSGPQPPTAVPTLTGVVNIAAGGAVTCAVLVGGSARCWGSNTAGQVGNQTPSATPVSSPVTVQGLDSLVGIATSGSHTCALNAAGQVSCFGVNSSGEVNGTRSTNSQPIPAVVLSSAVDVAAGPNFTCAVLADGTVRCWGDNAVGELGIGTTTPASGIQTIAGLTGAIAIAAAVDHACVSRADGTVACWGSRASGQLDGVNVFGRIQPSPIPVPNTTSAVAIAAGASVSCALLVSDAFRCWGLLGLQADGDPLFTIATTAGVAPISARGIAGGRAHTCARRAQGSAACWGENSLGQLGANFPTDQGAPAAVAGTAVAAVTAGDSHSCVRLSNGRARCWGDNGFGQAGDLRGGVRETPIEVADRFVFNSSTSSFVAVPLTGVLGVATGRSHSCAVLAGGSVSCWGSNSGGQLGNGTLNDPAFPSNTVDVVNLDGAAVAVTAGFSHTCALLVGGSVRCWGSNAFGQITGSPTPAPQPSPTTPLASIGLVGVVAIAAGEVHTCAVLRDGAVRCWGSNGSGRLGDNSVTDAIAVAPGGVHTCVVRSAGTAQCWGGNGSGQLGNGTLTASTAPVGVAQFAGFNTSCCPLIVTPVFTDVTGLTAIESGTNHTCAVRVDGQPFCWGNNVAGQVGDDTTTNRSSVIAVPSFRFNIDPSVSLTGRGRIAHVTALANCPAGHHVQIRASLTQGEVSGQGLAVGTCTGGVARYLVTVPAEGRGSFVPGSAVAEADAIVRAHGHVTETQEWTRAVEVAAER